MNRRPTLVLVALGLLAVVAAVAAVALANGASRAAADGPCRGDLSRSVHQPSGAELAAARLDELPLAPRSARVDLASPPFSRPTRITNPLFPISNLHSAILNGVVDGKAFKVETTLLAGTRMIGWGEGRCVEALASQYAAYLDGRLHEVAIDYYAQADDGSVWYLGEDVFNYEDGVVADRLGSWIAGRDGPGARRSMRTGPSRRTSSRPATASSSPAPAETWRRSRSPCRPTRCRRSARARRLVGCR